MSTARQAAPRFRVGDWVSFLYGPRRVRAQVVEDRGPIGVNRRRLYGVRLEREATDAMTFEMPEEDLQPAALPAPDKAAVRRYLKEGGLVALLRSNLVGGQDQRRAWLGWDPRGKLAHTFAADRGLVGGAPVPFFALHEGKVFTARQEEVTNFLMTFGLTRAEAADVLREVGTAP